MNVHQSPSAPEERLVLMVAQKQNNSWGINMNIFHNWWASDYQLLLSLVLLWLSNYLSTSFHVSSWSSPFFFKQIQIVNLLIWQDVWNIIFFGISIDSVLTAFYNMQCIKFTIFIGKLRWFTVILIWLKQGLCSQMTFVFHILIVWIWAIIKPLSASVLFFYKMWIPAAHCSTTYMVGNTK